MFFTIFCQFSFVACTTTNSAKDIKTPLCELDTLYLENKTTQPTNKGRNYILYKTEYLHNKSQTPLETNEKDSDLVNLFCKSQNKCLIKVINFHDGKFVIQEYEHIPEHTTGNNKKPQN